MRLHAPMGWNHRHAIGGSCRHRTHTQLVSHTQEACYRSLTLPASRCCDVITYPTLQRHRWFRLKERVFAGEHYGC